MKKIHIKTNLNENLNVNLLRGRFWFRWNFNRFFLVTRILIRAYFMRNFFHGYGNWFFDHCSLSLFFRTLLFGTAFFSLFRRYDCLFLRLRFLIFRILLWTGFMFSLYGCCWFYRGFNGWLLGCLFFIGGIFAAAFFCRFCRWRFGRCWFCGSWFFGRFLLLLRWILK